MQLLAFNLNIIITFIFHWSWRSNLYVFYVFYVAWLRRSVAPEPGRRMCCTLSKASHTPTTTLVYPAAPVLGRERRPVGELSTVSSTIPDPR